jgi:hypothetical protein
VGSGSNQLHLSSGQIRIDSTANGGILDTTVEADAHLSTNRLTQDSLTIADNSAVTLLPGGQTSLLTSLTIGAGGTLDITDNALVIDYTGASPVAVIRDKILSGRGGAGLGKGWNGAGITSSTAAQANLNQSESRSLGYAENALLPLGAYNSFRGVAVEDTSVLIAYTRTGDANLDGVVDNNDVTILGASYAPSVSKPNWALGDFDYNGFVDNDDVTLLGAFYNPTAAPVPQEGVSGGVVSGEVVAAASLDSLVHGQETVTQQNQTRVQHDETGTQKRQEIDSQPRQSSPSNRRSPYFARAASKPTSTADRDALIDLLARSVAADSSARDTLLHDRLVALRRRGSPKAFFGTSPADL